MGASPDFEKPAFTNPLDADLDAIRDNYHFLLMVAASGSIVLPGWQTTVTPTNAGQAAADYSQPVTITLTRGTKKIHIHYVWTDLAVSSIQMCYDDGVSSPGLTCFAAIPFYYDDDGNPYGTSDPTALTLLDGLISYWKMDETGTVSRADAHASNTLSVSSGGTLSERAGILSNGPDFRGVNDNCLITTSTDFAMGDTDFSVSFWYYADTFDGPNIVGRWRELTTLMREWVVRENATVLELVMGNLTTVLTGPTLSTTTWYHVVAMHDATNDELTLVANDGTVYTAAHAGGITAGSPAPEFAVGGTNEGSPSVDGCVDEVGAWSRLLSTVEITQLYNSGTGITYEDF